MEASSLTSENLAQRFSKLELKLLSLEAIVVKQSKDIKNLQEQVKKLTPPPCYLFLIPEQMLHQIMILCSSHDIAKFAICSRASRLESLQAAYHARLERYPSATIAYKLPTEPTASAVRDLYDLEFGSVMIFAGRPYNELQKTDQFMFNTRERKWCHVLPHNPDKEVIFNRSAEFETIYYKGQVLVFPDCDVNQVAGEQLEIYSLDDNNWRTVRPLGILDKAFAMGLAVSNGKMIVTGGHIINDRTNVILDTMYSISAKFEEGKEYILKLLSTRLTAPRSHHGSVSYRNEIWIAGGQKPTYEPTNSTEIFKTRNGEDGVWVPGPPMVKTRDGCPKLAVIEGKLYAIGGDFDVHDDLRSSIEVLDPITNRWQLLTFFKEARAFSTAAVVGRKVYVFGGCVPEISDDVTYLNTWDSYDVMTGKWESDDHPEFGRLYAGDMPPRAGGYAWCRAETIPDYYFDRVKG